MKYLILFFLSSLLFWSCSNTTETNKDNVSDTIEVDIDSTEMMNEVVYQVPSPDEFFSLLTNKNLRFKQGLTRDEKAQFTSRLAKEVNMGLYVADMAYLNSFGEMKTAVRYFAKVREMADQLGLSSSIPEQTMKKIEENSENTDSLRKISDESFYNVIQSLEESGAGKSLAIIMTAGWIETMYISLNLIDLKNFNANDPVLQKIAGQKVTFNNIIKNMERFENDAEVKTIMDKTITLDSFYIGLTKEESTVAKDTTKNVIGTSGKWKIEKTSLEKFKTEIEALRKYFVEQS